MSNLIEPETFKGCYNQFRKADSDRDIMVSQLLNSYESLHKEKIRTLQLYENERETSMLWQEKATAWRDEATQSKRVNESHPFVVMIIDGDGAKFRDDFFKAGDNGGGQAAQELKTQIKRQLQEAHPDKSIENWNIMVYFYANMDGLAKALSSRCILSSWTELQKFASGFGRANSLFSFVDVGYGKDKADHKCQEMLKVMLHISSCRHVFFGPCRDNGYLNLLEEYKYDPVIKEKLTLFSAEPATSGFVNLGFNIVSFPTVFRSDPITGFKPLQNPAFNIGIQPFPPAPPGLSYPNSIDDASDITTSSIDATLPFPSPASGNDMTPVPNSWAVVSKLSNGPVIDIYSKQAPPRKLKYILLNAANQRVDTRLSPADINAVKSLENRARSQGRNLCNYYHLIGSCEKGDNCNYLHDIKPRLTSEERLALWHKSRGIVCSEGRWCESPLCLSGHHCKNVYNGQPCTWGSKCFFKDTHDSDVKATLKVFEDGTREDLTLQAMSNGR